MKGYIVVTGILGLKNCISVKEIVTVDEQSDGTAYISCKYLKATNKKTSTLGMRTLDSFAEVVAKIEEALK